MKQYGDVAPTPPLYGIYNVETFIQNKDTIVSLTTDTLHWKQLIVSFPNSAFLKMMNDSIKSIAFQPDTVTKKIGMSGFTGSAKKSNLVYSMPEKDALVISGKLDDDSVIIKMKKYDLKNFRLVSRGFHWINEYPLNR